MKKFCAILFSFVLIVVLALPAAAEGESAALSDTSPGTYGPGCLCGQPRHEHRCL